MFVESAVVRPHGVEAATAALHRIDRSVPADTELRRRRRPRGRPGRSAGRVRAPPPRSVRAGHGEKPGMA